MAYNPGITDRSGEILAQGTAAAAQIRMQGYQNATNSLLKGFSDLSKKQQEEELEISDANALLNSDPEVEKKIRASGNPKLIAQLDKIKAPPSTKLMDKLFGSGYGPEARSILKYSKGLGAQEDRAATRTLRDQQAADAGFRKDDAGFRGKASLAAEARAAQEAAAATRDADIYTRNLELTRNLQRQYNPAVPFLVPDRPSSPTDFTRAFDPSSRVLPTGVPGSLMDQSSMMRDNINPPPTPAQSISGNPFVRSPNMAPMSMSAAGIPPPSDRNNGFLARAQPSFTSGGSRAGENSLLASLVRSGASLTSDKVSDAITKQAEIDFNKAKMPEGTEGPFTDVDGEQRTYIIRAGEMVDKDSGLPLQSTVTDLQTGFASKKPTVFPKRGFGMPRDKATSRVPAAATGFATDVPRYGDPKKLTTSNGTVYTRTTTK